ncbi:hypothetical protein ACFL2V_17335 [Pseudomonadota bacterium]
MLELASLEPPVLLAPLAQIALPVQVPPGLAALSAQAPLELLELLALPGQVQPALLELLALPAVAQALLPVHQFPEFLVVVHQLVVVPHPVGFGFLLPYLFFFFKFQYT